MIFTKMTAYLGFLGVLFVTNANAATLKPGEWQMHVQFPGFPKGLQEKMLADSVLMCVHPGETTLKSFMYYTNYGCDFSKSGVQRSGFSGTIVCHRGPHTFREYVSESIAANGKSFVAHIQLTHVPGINPMAMKYMRASTYRGKWVGGVCTQARSVQ